MVHHHSWQLNNEFLEGTIVKVLILVPVEIVLLISLTLRQEVTL